LKNRQSDAAFNSITNNIKHSYRRIPSVDRVKQNYDRVVKNEEEAKKITPALWKDIKALQGKCEI